MLAKINSCSLSGLLGYCLTVEVDVGVGLSSFDIVGLPDASVRESKERVRAALKNAGFEFPLRRITVNLAPADIRKEGPSLDLPIAVGILAATGQISAGEYLDASAFVGELSLDGELRPVSGSLSIADHLAGEAAIRRLFLPQPNADEASIAQGIEVYGVSGLRELCDVLAGAQSLPPNRVEVGSLFARARHEREADMAEVKGQRAVKRALEIAAAGGHNLLMIGSPGSGKTMLARRLPTILPELTPAESIAVTKIYSVAGQLPRDQVLITERPFRAPHHSASAASIIGGGVHPRPGEISFASHGVLFLDEMPEFQRDVLEALRQPLEEQTITVARVHGRVDYPADFQLVGAMNPCPCGFFGDPLKPCTCTPHQRKQYFRKLSGPLLDRIDLHIEVSRVNYQEISGQAGEEESSALIRTRVLAARERQTARFAGSGCLLNANMSRRDLERCCRLGAEAQDLLRDAFHYLKLSGRAHDRILKVARTIADLAAEEQIGAAQVAEAIQYRSLDREEYFS